MVATRHGDSRACAEGWRARHVGAMPIHAAAADTITIPGAAARAGALALLHGVLALGRPLEAGMDRALAGMPPADRALASAIARATLRWLTDLDTAIDGAMAKALPPDARARSVLRLALAQAWLLETPPHAIISTALPLVAGGPRRLVHGVLATLLRAPSPLRLAPTLPAPWRDRWHAAYGDSATGSIAAALTSEPSLDLTLANPDRTDDWCAALGGVSLMPGHVRLSRGAGGVPTLPGFAEGAWWVQDLAASLPARLLAPRPGERVLDLCAAPGGKTLQLAAAGARVTALDASARRMERLAHNLARTGLEADLVVADARGWSPPAPFDAILVDAPCSATGIARRHPDVLHLKSARDFAPLVAQQDMLLTRATGWLAPAGRLVYATCSLEPEEGEARAVAAVAAGALRIDPIADALPRGLAPSTDGWLRTLPGQVEGGVDGFFVARFVRA